MNYFNLKWSLGNPKLHLYRYTAIYIEDEDLPYEEAKSLAIKVAKYLQYYKKAENIYGSKAYFEEEFKKMYAELDCETYEEFETKLCSMCKQAEINCELPLLMYVRDVTCKIDYWKHYTKERIERCYEETGLPIPIQYR